MGLQRHGWPRAFALGLVILGTGCADPTPRDEARLEALLEQVDSLRIAAGIPGLAVGVLRNGEVVALRGFGVADVATGRPVTPDTPFDIASVMKPLSATLAMRLQAEGVLDLDAPLSGYPDFDGYCRDARELGGLFYGDWACDNPAISLRHLLSMSSNAPLGERFFYNPVVYSWASRPIASAAGAPFSSLIERYVITPAGMLQSARKHRDLPLRDDLARDLAVPYHLTEGGEPQVSDLPPPQGDGAAGGMVSTVRDLARFDLALDSGALVSDSLRESMWRPIRPGLPYGLGWFLGTLDGHRVVWHTGLWEGAYSALYLKVPDPGRHPGAPGQLGWAPVGDPTRRGGDRAVAVCPGVPRVGGTGVGVGRLALHRCHPEPRAERGGGILPTGVMPSRGRTRPAPAVSSPENSRLLPTYHAETFHKWSLAGGNYAPHQTPLTEAPWVAIVACLHLPLLSWPPLAVEVATGRPR